jgi:hypothetical protein
MHLAHGAAARRFVQFTQVVGAKRLAAHGDVMKRQVSFRDYLPGQVEVRKKEFDQQGRFCF